MMPTTTMASALRPLLVSSSPTCGPTNSLLRSSTVGSITFRASITWALCWAEFMPFCTGRRICTEVPKLCTCTSW
jgi:hypothetical protein